MIYLNILICLLSFFYYILSLLLKSNKIQPSIYYGYSAKSRFFIGLAFTFFAIGMIEKSPFFAIMYLITFTYAMFIEKKYKSSFETQCP
jgi:hypothetical protein